MKAKTWIMFLLTFGFFALLMRDVAQETPLDGVRKTEPLRQNLSRLRHVLLSLERQFQSMPGENESEQIVLMQSAVEILKEYLLPHLAAEEAVLYPAVDRQLPFSPASPTQAMRREHDILRRWIAELEALANGCMADANAFARRGERLLGLIEAHFEVEEEILFPVLDQAEPLPIASQAP